MLFTGKKKIKGAVTLTVIFKIVIPSTLVSNTGFGLNMKIHNKTIWKCILLIIIILIIKKCNQIYNQRFYINEFDTVGLFLNSGNLWPLF